MPFTDTVTLLSEDPVLAEFTKMLGEQAGQTLDVITRDKLMAGTNVQYANNAADRAAVDATDVINQAEVNEAVLTLKNANAQKLKEMVKPDAGYETRPIIATYVGIIHPNTTSKLVNESNTKWISVEKYANKADIMPGEVGALGDVRFIETTYAKVYAGAGTGPVDVYATLILGRDAYGTIALEGNSMEMIFKPIGSAGATDPLNQRGSIGWKSWKTAKILQELFMIRVEHAL